MNGNVGREVNSTNETWKWDRPGIRTFPTKPENKFHRHSDLLFWFHSYLCIHCLTMSCCGFSPWSPPLSWRPASPLPGSAVHYWSRARRQPEAYSPQGCLWLGTTRSPSFAVTPPISARAGGAAAGRRDPASGPPPPRSPSSATGATSSRSPRLISGWTPEASGTRPPGCPLWTADFRACGTAASRCRNWTRWRTSPLSCSRPPQTTIWYSSFIFGVS